MTRMIPLFAATEITLFGMLTSADADTRKTQARLSSSARVDHGQVVRHAKGPRWAMPNECYKDLGYGRFGPCL